MKGRKLLALALALALCLGLAVPALATGSTVQDHTSFDDLKEEQWSWAWATIDDAIRRGLFVGYTPYTDDQGKTITNFGPGDPVTESVGLTLCARMMVDKDDREIILKDRLEEMRELIPGTAANPDDPNAPSMWFRREAATCLELGILSQGELALLCDANRLNEPMTKADFAKYLVRAMGLEDVAKGMNASDLPFKDQALIRREYRPYVKLLSSYGVLTGDEKGNFNPNGSVSRAVCATMLTRAIKNIKEKRSMVVELPRYTTYDWTEGYIQSVTLQDDGTRIMTLQSDVSGDHSITLPVGMLIYQHNMKVEPTELRTGTFARVCYNPDDSVNMVRLTPAGSLSKVTGPCDEVADDQITVDGVTYTIDRFTEISAGGRTGDRTIIDPEAGYTDAELVANSRKVVLSMELTGGTRLVEGILTDVTTTDLGAAVQTTATVNSYNGLPTTYVVGNEVEITVDGRAVDGLKASFEGKRVTLRVSDEELDTLKSVDVDATGQYVQGVLGFVNTKVSPKRVEITLPGAARRTPFEVDEACAITYENQATTLDKLQTGIFVTGKVDGGTLTWLSGWTGLETTSGTLTGLSYGDPTVLKVTKDDGTVSEFSIPMAELTDVTILVKGEDADITRLATGDAVSVTLHYHDVTQIDVTPRSADVNGTLHSVTFNADGSAVLTVRFQDGTTRDYAASSATSITRGDKLVGFTELVNARGQAISLVTEGDRALSVQFSGTSVAQDSVEGVVLNKADSERMLTILVADPDTGATRPVNVHAASGTTVITTSGDVFSNISRIIPNDVIVAYGAYNADGTFEARSIVRK